MDWKKYCKPQNWHPLANLAPLMTEERLITLAESVKEHGLQDPVVIFEGKVLDGRNRMLACERAGRAPKFTKWHENGISPLEFVITKNVRREMTFDQRAAWAAKLVPELRKEAEKRTGGRPKKGQKPSAEVREVSGKSAEHAARKVGISARSVEKAVALEKKRGGTLDEILNGRTTLAKAEKEIYNEGRGSLSDLFVSPPFSVLDPTQEYWKKRKLEWTSVFDPVLCECMVRWFGKAGGSILDPFAGGSTRGIVATSLGYDYTGIEWGKGQAATNLRQANAVLAVKPAMQMPRWIQADGPQFNLPAGEEYDLVFTSAPHYSGDQTDRSVWGNYEAFLAWYENIFRQAVARLKKNRFLVVVVEELTDEKGFIRCFTEHNKTLFERLGLFYYNRAILRHAIDNLPEWTQAPFAAEIVCFWHGDEDAKLIPQELGLVDDFKVEPVRPFDE